LNGCGYDAYCVYGTAPKEITTKDESLMECPFPIEMADNDDNDDPEIDKDEEQMSEKKASSIVPLEDYQVTKKGPHMSEFDEEMRRKNEEDEED
jgi:hypothetical protein